MRKTEEEFKSVHIDLEKKIYEINGKPIEPRTTEFSIDFEGGQWSMRKTTTTVYSKNKTKSTDEEPIQAITYGVEEPIKKSERLVEILKEASSIINELARLKVNLEIGV